MEIGYKYIPVAIAGLVAISAGLPAAHRLRAPYDILAAVAALAGSVALVMGSLLILIPNFFRS